MTEVWFRNPHNYIRELAEVGVARVTWDRGALAKRRIDPLKHADLYFPGKPWRVMLIGNQGSAEYTSESNGKPVGVYSTWDGHEDKMPVLEEMMAYPVGEHEEFCEDMSLPEDERPVFGQKNIVVVTNLPDAKSSLGRAIIRKFRELQEDYPEVTLFIHGMYSWRVNFGMDWSMVDVDPRTIAGKGRVYLPSGKEMIAERTISTPQWVHLLGMQPIDLTKEPRNRTIFNIKSALWAGEHFNENIAFATRPRGEDSVAHQPVDIESEKPKVIEIKSKKPFTAPIVPKPTDKINCNSCQLQNNCKFYREGSVCSVPGSDPAPLAKHFNTRDPDQIIDGMGRLMALQANRLERGIREEDEYAELNPEVTKIANQLFTNGAKLAKLLDPARFAGPSVQVNVGAGGQAAMPQNANQVLGGIIRELESRGIARDQITPEMVQGMLAEMAQGKSAPKVIEAQVIASE